MPPQNNTASTPPVRQRRGIRPPKRWDVRLTVSVPALVTLIVLGMGTANYFVFMDFVEQAQKVYPKLDTGTYQFAILGIFVLFALIALTSSILLARSLLSPLRKLADAAATIARGDFRPDVASLREGGFEIAQLGQTFHSMVDFINSMIEQREVFLTEAVHDGALIFNTHGRVTTINSAGAALLNAAREHMVGKTLRQLREESPELAPGLLEWCEKILSRKDTLAATEPVLLPAVAQSRALYVAASLVRDENNFPSAILVNFRDAAIGGGLKDMFSGTDQLAALGAFTYGLSNELRNPLGALKGATQLLEEEVAGNAPSRPYLQRIIHEVNRLDQLIRELYDFSHAPVGQAEPVNPRDLVTRSLAQARMELPGDLLQGKTLREEIEPNLPRVFVQPDRMLRAITNILLNAYEFTPVDGVILVRVSTLPETGDGAADPGATARDAASMPTPRPVALDIINSGAPLTPEMQRNIFEPFFSTKKAGTGLGLSIAYQIVSQNRGQLSVSNTPEGVCFRFVFRILQP